MLLQDRPQFALLGQPQKFFVGNTAPKEEREPRGQLEVSNPTDGPGGAAARAALDAEQEARRNEDCAKGRLDPRVETPAVFPARGEQPHQRFDVGLAGGTAVGSPRERSQDLFRAGLLKVARRRTAHENALSAFGVAWTRRIEGAADKDIIDRDRRYRGRADTTALSSAAFGFRGFTEDPGAHHVHARLQRQADLVVPGVLRFFGGTDVCVEQLDTVTIKAQV